MRAKIRSSSPSLSFRRPRPVRAGRRNPARAFRTHQEKDAVIIAGEPALMIAYAHPHTRTPARKTPPPGGARLDSACIPLAPGELLQDTDPVPSNFLIQAVVSFFHL